MNQSRRIVVVGAGRVGRHVIEELPADWHVTAVDIHADVLARLAPRQGRVDVVGDATSRLVLARCELGSAATLVLTTNSDEVNLEVARIATAELGVDEVVCVLEDASRAPAGMSVVARAQVTAAQVINRVGIGEMRGVGIGLGQGELRQVSVLAGSPAIGRPLRDLHPREWLLAALYREGHLLVPHGDTAVMPGDQVLLVGEPAELGAIAAFFRGGAATFPATYGSRLGFVGGEPVQACAEWLALHTAAREVVELSPNLLDPGITPPSALSTALQRESVGCLLVPGRTIPLMARVGLALPWWAHQLLAAQVPVLVVRGPPKVDRVLLAIGPDQESRSIGGPAIDLARQLGVPLHFLTVLPAVVSHDAAHAADPTRDLLAYSRLHGVEPERVVERGNPIDRIRANARKGDLLVLGHSRARRNTLFTPDVSTWLLHNTECTTLFVPWTRPGQPA